MIIGLVGKRTAGKDTVGAYLVKEYSFERKAFADPLKRSVAALFDIPFSEIDRLKSDEYGTVVSIAHTHEDEIKIYSFVEFLQRYGTESHRGVFGNSFWIDQTLPMGGFYTGRKIVITDCRFKNEAERIQTLGGIIIRINRPGLDDKDRHSSETEQDEIKPDWIIVNDSDLQNLYTEIEMVLSNLGYHS